MKCIVLIALVCVATLRAHPTGLTGLEDVGVSVGGHLGTGINDAHGTDASAANVDVKAHMNGNIGASLMDGMRNTLFGGLANGLGWIRGLQGNLGFNNGAGYEAKQFNNGASGHQKQGAFGNGVSEIHDKGSHHQSSSAVTQSESSDSHDVGASMGFGQGSFSDSGFNQFGNGSSVQANEFNEGFQNLAIN